MTASLFASNDSCNSFLRGVSLDHVRSLDRMESVDFQTLQPLATLSLDSMIKSQDNNNNNNDSTLTYNPDDTSNFGSLDDVEETSTEALAPPAPVAPKRTSSASKKQFLDRMKAIMAASSSKPAAATDDAAARLSPTIPLFKSDLGELTNSKTWVNLGSHQDVENYNKDIFRTRNDSIDEPKKVPARTESVDKNPIHRRTFVVPQRSVPLLVGPREACEPRENDVLLGRGGRSGNHPGNKKYLALKDKMQKQYMKANKNEKKDISQELVNIVNHTWHGRFLRMDAATKQWFEIDNESARKKCSQALRELNTPEVRAAKRRRYAKN